MGVVADGPAGKGQWAVMGEGNLKFNLNEATKQINYSPTTYHEMGSQKVGDKDISFKFWSPNAQHVSVKVFDENGSTKDAADEEGCRRQLDGQRQGRLEEHGRQGLSLSGDRFEGKTVERADPYATVMQGEQRGISRTYVNIKGEQTNQFYIDGDVYQKYKSQIEGPDPALAQAAREKAYAESRTELVKFEIDDEVKADSAVMVFKDENGRQLSKDELINRLGRFDSSLIDKLRSGKYNDLWSNNIDDQGRIKMVNDNGAWSTLVNNLDKMTGLRYEMQMFKKDAQGKMVLLNDTNKDGKLSTAERKATSYNDRWSADSTLLAYSMANNLGVNKNTPGATLDLPIGGIGGLDDGVLVVPAVNLKTPFETRQFEKLMAIELKGMSSLIQTELSGVIGYDMLKNYRLTLDYHKAKIRLTK